MSKPRTRQFWMSVHRYLGLATLVFLFIAAVTGCFLCFDKKIDAALNPDLFKNSSTGASIGPTCNSMPRVSISSARGISSQRRRGAPMSTVT